MWAEVATFFYYVKVKSASGGGISGFQIEELKS